MCASLSLELRLCPCRLSPPHPHPHLERAHLLQVLQNVTLYLTVRRTGTSIQFMGVSGSAPILLPDTPVCEGIVQVRAALHGMVVDCAGAVVESRCWLLLGAGHDLPCTRGVRCRCWGES